MVAAQASIRTALRNTVLLMAKKEVRTGQGASRVQTPPPLRERASSKFYCQRPEQKACPAEYAAGSHVSEDPATGCGFDVCVLSLSDYGERGQQTEWQSTELCGIRSMLPRDICPQSQQGIYLTAYLLLCFPNGSMHSVAQIPFLACRHGFSRSEPGRRSEHAEDHHVSNNFPVEPAAASPQNSPE